MTDITDTPPDVLPAPTAAHLKWRLCLMMFLQYFIQGCYLPIVSLYLQEQLGFSTFWIGVFGSALAVGPLFAPFLIGQLVDRRYASERVLAFCHLAGGVIMVLLYLQTEEWPVIVLGTLYSILYIPTLMLTNSLCFHHLTDSKREFPLIRLWGTIGFVVPAWLIEYVFLRGLEGEQLNQARGVALVTAGIVGLLMAAYSLTLPHTPPTQREDRRFAPGVASRMLAQPHVLVLVLVSFLIAIVHKFYFVLNAPYLKEVLVQGGVRGAWEQRISSLGQIAEVLVMAVLGLMITRWGFKRTMLLGILAYAVRCVIFAYALRLPGPFPVTMTIVCTGQLLHGFCFGCFMAAAYIYFDRTSPADIRGSVQNLYGTFVIGLGFFAGGFVSGWIGESFTSPSGRNWTGIWLSAAALAAACWMIFALTFESQADEPQAAEAG